MMRILFALLAFALALRIPGLYTDFWLDELWSLLLSTEVDSALGIVGELRHDNNHHLNTLVLYALGDRDQWILYRLHAFLAGLVSVALAWFCARGSGRLDAIFAAALTAASYLMIVYSSEARGYSLAVCFGFGAWIAARRFVADPRWTRAVALWLCIVLGFASHLSFVHVFIGIGIWLAIELARTAASPARALADLFRAYGVPVFVTFCVLVFVIQGMLIGGGPDYRLDQVLRETGSLAVGGPGGGPFSFATALLYLAACLASIAWLRRAGRSEWILFAVVIFLSPALALALNPPQVLFPRYFLLSIAFSYLALAHAGSELARRSAAGRWGVAVVLTAFAAANAVHVLDLPGTGRGSYRDAVHWMAERTPGATVTVESDDDFGTKLLLSYYQRFLPEGRAMRYSDRDDSPAGAPLWRIERLHGPLGEVAPHVRGDHGGVYELERTYPYTSGLSGSHWIVYRRVGPP